MPGIACGSAETKEDAAMKMTVALATLASLPGVVLAANTEMSIEFPNKMGTVVFNHKKHANLSGDDCTVCHDRPGQIRGFGKAYAHTVCIGCHEPEIGKIQGPTTCNGCHAAR